MNFDEFMKYKEFLANVQEAREEIIKEVADWDDPTKRKIDAGTVSCDDDERYEREPIRKAIKKMFPIFKNEDIDAAIEHCCKKTGQSRQREDFYKCVWGQLFAKL